MAIRRLVDGKPAEAVEVLADSIAQRLVQDGYAVPANGPGQVPSDEPQHVDDSIEVHGITDRDPDFFEKQAEREAELAAAKGMTGPPADRMYRRGRQK